MYKHNIRQAKRRWSLRDLGASTRVSSAVSGSDRYDELVVDSESSSWM